MELGDRLWGMNMIKEFLYSSSVAEVGATNYIKNNSVVNEDRDGVSHLPAGFEGFYYSERNWSAKDKGVAGYFGFVNRIANDESFYITLPPLWSERSLTDIQELCVDATMHGWGPSYDWESAIGWSISNFWDITDLVMRGSSIKEGLFGL